MEFLILGPLEVRDGGDTVRLGAAKQRALLAVLLLHANETVSTGRLVEELWGERPPATAEKLVQGYVHALRKHLGEGVVLTSAPGYRLVVDPRSLDLAEFERLTEAARVEALPRAVELRDRALALWRGPALANVELEGPERHALARLADLRLVVQIEQIDAELELGQHLKLVGPLESLVAQHPYQERLHAQLMLALYRSGRQADALEAYRRLRTRLDGELGLQPGQELRDLEAAILRQDEGLLVAPGAESEQTAVPAGVEPAVQQPRPRRRRVLAGLVLAALVLAAAVAALFLRADGASVVVPPNSVAAIDPATNRVLESAILPTGIRPGPVAGGGGSVWIGGLDDALLTRVDLATRKVVKNVSLSATPDAIDVARGFVWVVNGRLGTLFRVDPELYTWSQQELGTRSTRYTYAGVDHGEGFVWAAFGDSTIARVQPRTLDGESAVAGDAGPAALVVAYDAVWVANSGSSTVQRFSTQTFQTDAVQSFTVGRAPRGIAAGDGAIWVVCADDDSVWRIDGSLSSRATQPIRVGDGPTSVAFGAGAVWVTNTFAGTVSRIDPATNEVVRTIPVGNAPTGIAVAGGLVWVAVQAP
jgi:YVTN family beta-propeller protein